MDEMKNTPYYKAIYMDKMYPCANYPLKKPKNVESDVPPSFLPSFSHLGLTTAFHAEEPPVNKPDGKLTESYVADSVTRLRGKIRAVRAINPHPNLFIDRNYDLMNQKLLELEKTKQEEQQLRESRCNAASSSFLSFSDTANGTKRPHTSPTKGSMSFDPKTEGLDTSFNDNFNDLAEVSIYDVSTAPKPHKARAQMSTMKSSCHSKHQRAIRSPKKSPVRKSIAPYSTMTRFNSFFAETLAGEKQFEQQKYDKREESFAMEDEVSISIRKIGSPTMSKRQFHRGSHVIEAKAAKGQKRSEMTRNFRTIKEKIAIVENAKAIGMKAAGRAHNVEASNIRRWRAKEELLRELSRNGQEQLKTVHRGRAYRLLDPYKVEMLGEFDRYLELGQKISNRAMCLVYRRLSKDTDTSSECLTSMVHRWLVRHRRLRHVVAVEALDDVVNPVPEPGYGVDSTDGENDEDAEDDVVIS